ncbi:FAD-dependent monooxygenase [Streptomyces sp. NBC_01795]|uniref:FAD-dependent monooxygenase n=1 Tax=unclassified Streptomyces TaxID=2593676 RepID=UPI002DD95D9D|nr:MULTISPECIES: FAD-dependent monooxygenase [unclassified Streptomyces]WSA96059.1 FAD-dependent monooxygenase [Streptomyces sp. NBC_01795]WSS11319.1 FAD-dependent monooxygenase [Streptomyces sp. NBC_01186]
MEEIVIVGAGPTGLWLAAELRLQGTSVTVLEVRRERDPHSRALTIHPRTLEILGMRGLADDFIAAGRPLPTGHFGALETRLDFSALETPYPFTLFLPQARTEELLEEHARARGARIRRGHRVTALEQGAEAVRVEVEGPAGPYRLEARYAVGCDGTRSQVREAAGIDFPGTGTSVWGWLGDVVLDQPPGGPVSAFGPDGGVMAVPMTDGLTRLVGVAPEDHRSDHPGELTLEEVREKTVRVLGTDYGMRDPFWLSRFGNATRQAAAYREGRVLLAGDAAHMHFPAGGVGLNVGFQDATNLGWKLAATVRGSATASSSASQGAATTELLDTYHAERHPVGARLLDSTRAQTALMAAGSAEGRALRAYLADMIRDLPDFSRALAEQLCALDVRYPPTRLGPDADVVHDADAEIAAHPLTGARAPDLVFADGTSLFPLMTQGRHLLLDLTGATDADADADTDTDADTGTTTDAASLGGPLPPGTRRHAARLRQPDSRWSTVSTVLIRPDGHVARADGHRASVSSRPGSRAAA